MDFVLSVYDCYLLLLDVLVLSLCCLLILHDFARELFFNLMELHSLLELLPSDIIIEFLDLPEYQTVFLG